MQRAIELSGPAVVFREDVLLIPGECDVDICRAAARYSFSNLYFCLFHFIEACADGDIPEGSIICRVQGV